MLNDDEMAQSVLIIEEEHLNWLRATMLIN